MCIRIPMVGSDGRWSLTKVSPCNQLSLVKSCSSFSHEDANQLSRRGLPAAVFADDDLDTFSLLESFLNPCSLGLWRNIKLMLEVRHFNEEKETLSEFDFQSFQVD